MFLYDVTYIHINVLHLSVFQFVEKEINMMWSFKTIKKSIQTAPYFDFKSRCLLETLKLILENGLPYRTDTASKTAEKPFYEGKQG